MLRTFEGGGKLPNYDAGLTLTCQGKVIVLSSHKHRVSVLNMIKNATLVDPALSVAPEYLHHIFADENDHRPVTGFVDSSASPAFCPANRHASSLTATADPKINLVVPVRPRT